MYCTISASQQVFELLAVCWYRAAECLSVWTKTKRGELVLSNKINTLKFFQNLSLNQILISINTITDEIKRLRRRLNTSIYIGSDQKTLRPIVNLYKTRLTKLLTNKRLQSDHKRVRKENTSLEHTRDEHLSLNHTENLDLSFPSSSNTQSPIIPLRKSYCSTHTCSTHTRFLKASFENTQRTLLQSQHQHSSFSKR